MRHPFHYIERSRSARCRAGACLLAVLTILTSFGLPSGNVETHALERPKGSEAFDVQHLVRTAQASPSSGIERSDVRVVLERLRERDETRDRNGSPAGRFPASTPASWILPPSETASPAPPSPRYLFIIHGALLM